MTWMVKASPTLDFLTKVAKDPKLQERYHSDPRAVMKEHGVPDDHADMLLSKDPDKIVKTLLHKKDG